MSKNGKIIQGNSIFFKNKIKENEIDEKTFIEWKSELQRELPSFWDSMVN